MFANYRSKANKFERVLLLLELVWFSALFLVTIIWLYRVSTEFNQLANWTFSKAGSIQYILRLNV
ncbi:hypothetical protein A0O36_01068 [Piscirickettsiaceae bacterium NZ-RLO1]|nr:hypothetical protein A0O36_01068 [Piscirickettsiaceae bacterium NZ-RLO1]